MALNDHQRMVLVAMYYVDKGIPEEEAIQRLRQRFGFLDVAQAAALLESADRARFGGEALNSARDEQEIGEALTGPRGRRDIVAEATVIISAPGREDVYRTVRFDDLADTMTVAELNERIRQTTEEFEREYGAEGGNAAWTMRFAM